MFKSDKKIVINYAQKQGKKESTIKDPAFYFTVNDSKNCDKLYCSQIEIPMNYLDLFKKNNPLSKIEFPDEKILYSKEVPYFIVKKDY